ncbi:glycerophosphodiester phosphodiesterase family protein [Amnibacterium kyonggiense]|uniref:Glycerophosphoryl diester phosphodiesterase n=1 Tax=Amnibacterium kyonggiense TaxID=595671 RepID=A0A4R7FL31_9MICO|nr:glycerophosphodiester phosphodiesterase family protein [Amnibacterium kyonggiense]TDS77068.1 glycerophosphoryl diester phosphodiesterase [Amnibacterium kyonggiense]
MSRTGWFDELLPRILAHRGLALEAPENSIAAFEAAIAAGATHLETDVRATADGVAVLVHDATTPDGRDVSSLTLSELRAALPAAATLAEALTALPEARFNIDVKHAAAVAPTGVAVTAAAAAQRVLLTSFSGRRRREVLRLVPTAATSASSGSILGVVGGLRLRTPAVTRLALRRVHAVQIPERALRTDLATPWSIAEMHAAGVEVHFWVVNDPARMRELVARGADGIVTDRPDLARDALR